MLIEVAGEHPRFLRKQLVDVVDAMLQARPPYWAHKGIYEPLRASWFAGWLRDGLPCPGGAPFCQASCRQQFYRVSLNPKP